MAKTMRDRLEEMQQGLVMIMDAVRKEDLREAERLLLITGGLMDEALRIVPRK